MNSIMCKSLSKIKEKSLENIKKNALSTRDKTQYSYTQPRKRAASAVLRTPTIYAANRILMLRVVATV
jgi:hypothetical protein